MNDNYFDIDNLTQKIYLLADDIKADNYKVIANLIKNLIIHFWKGDN